MINWLHLTDWHVGQSAQGHLWPNLRSEFEKDVRRLVEKYGAIDLVFITGDLVQSGQRKQFHELEQNLSRMWIFFDSLGCVPKLITVPGNHDLRRPDSSKSAALALNAWNEQADVRETFWRKTPSDLRRFVEKSFEEYERWLQESSAPLLPTARGLLPGDAAATYEKDGMRIAIIGLNSTFLQLRSGNYEKRLAVSVRQFANMCGGDYVSWLEDHHFSVLMTHQPPSWLSDESSEEFRREIAPPGRFRLQLSGHLHTSKTTVESVAGSPFSLAHQGASLFGLEFFGDERKAVRQHGYLFGQWDLRESEVTERLWPRAAVEKEGGALGFIANPPSYLDEDSAIRNTFKIQTLRAQKSASSLETKPTDIRTETTSTQSSLLLGPPLDEAEVTRKLKRALRFSHSAQPHHLAVRADERQAFVDSLQDQRFAWLVADWGMGKDGFLASVLKSETGEGERLRFEDRLFQLQCDTFEKVADVEQAFLPQFGIPVVDFLQCITSAGESCLILDGIQAALTESVEKPQLIRLIDLLLDQAPTLSIVVVSRTPFAWRISPIEIHPLDLPDLRAYVQNHPDTQPEFTTADVLERFFDASGGLPVHADRMLERLRVASFDAVLDEENALIELAAVEAPLHKALQQAIAAVRKSDEENGSSGIPLLKILSILTFGETIEQLRHFLPHRSLFPRDAEALDSAALIDPIPLNLSTPVISNKGKGPSSSTIGPKVLRVPKQVRDTVLSSLTSDDKTELLAAAGEFFFGRGWRVGRKPKLRKVPLNYREYVISGVGNEYAVLQLMISHAKETDDQVNLKAAVRLGLHYCGILKGADRNRDLRLVALGLLRLLEGSNLESDMAELNRLCGRACRLTGHHEEAVAHFKASLEHSKGRSGGEARTYALLEMAGSLNVVGEKDATIETTKQVEASAAPGSLIESQAKSKSIRFEPKSTEREAKQVAMKKKARSKGWISHANDMSLLLALDTDDQKKKRALFDEVLTSTEEGWNRYRAAVEKCLLAVRNDDLATLTARDRRDLLAAYGYSHTQRLELFDRCHEALWGILESEGDWESLYRLFKHSSFIWRIRGDDATELKYFERLNSLRPASEIQGPQAALLEVQYFIKRAAILLSRLLGDGARTGS